MNLDIPWTITAILAASSFLSPISVALINNHHNAKIRKMELDHDEYLRRIELQQQFLLRQADIYYNDKKIAFSEFIKIAGEYTITRFSDSTYGELQAARQKAILFCNVQNQLLLKNSPNSFICTY